MFLAGQSFILQKSLDSRTSSPPGACHYVSPTPQSLSKIAVPLPCVQREQTTLSQGLGRGEWGHLQSRDQCATAPPSNLSLRTPRITAQRPQCGTVTRFCPA